MIYREFQPARSLRRYVLSYWYFHGPARPAELVHRIPLTGTAMLAVIVRLNRVNLAGPRLQPLQTVIKANDEFFGVHFFPGSTEALLGIRGASLRDVSVDAETVLGSEWTSRLLARIQSRRDVRNVVPIFNEMLAALRPRASLLDNAVLKSAALIIGSMGAVPIKKLADEVGLSARQLRRRFRAATGVTPKELSLIRRARAAIVDAGYAPSIRWGEIAAERGYADQSHLIRDIQRTLGTTPVGFMHHARRIKHVRVRR